MFAVVKRVINSEAMNGGVEWGRPMVSLASRLGVPVSLPEQDSDPRGGNAGNSSTNQRADTVSS